MISDYNEAAFDRTICSFNTTKRLTRLTKAKPVTFSIHFVKISALVLSVASFQLGADVCLKPSIPLVSSSELLFRRRLRPRRFRLSCRVFPAPFSCLFMRRTLLFRLVSYLFPQRLKTSNCSNDILGDGAFVHRRTLRPNWGQLCSSSFGRYSAKQR